METREVAEKGQQLQKAFAENKPASDVLNLMRDLKKNLKPTEDLLRATNIGKIINRFKGSPNHSPEVKNLAADMIRDWREAINRQKSRTSGSSTPVNGTASPAPTSASKAAAPATSKPAASAVPPDKRTNKTDKAPIDGLTDDPARDRCIGLLYDGLCLGSELAMKQIFTIAQAIEKAAINLPESKNNSTTPFYREKIRSLFQNLKNKQNPALRKKILSGSISPDVFVKMTHEEMKSKEQLEADKKMEKENMDKAMVAQEVKAISTSLECGKCHKRKVSYSQAQTRSADEPMTTFCECMFCGNRWKFS